MQFCHTDFFSPTNTLALDSWLSLPNIHKAASILEKNVGQSPLPPTSHAQFYLCTGRRPSNTNGDHMNGQQELVSRSTGNDVKITQYFAANDTPKIWGGNASNTYLQQPLYQIP